MKKSRHLLPTLLLGVFALLGSQTPANAAQFCVSSAATLQTALATAASNGVDDEVRIVQGTYVGNFVYASTQANKLSVLGGYTAGCAGRVLNPVNTVLDGNQANTVLVLSAPNVAAEFLVEGLTLRMGNRQSGDGGGLYAVVGNLGAVTVNLNHIENNTAGYYRGYEGGGAYISATTATFTNNSITGNTASGSDGGGGGGVSIFATAAVLTNNNITGNTSSNGTGGGGAYISASSATLTDNSITGNTASGIFGGSGGGVYIQANTATISNNRITGNTAGSDGYGGGAYISATAATLTKNNITGNTASGYYSKGGGAYIYAAAAILTNNNITGNTSRGYEIDFDGHYGGGGGVSIAATTPTLTNNNITGNTAHSGGGAFIEAYNASTLTAALTNNSITGNKARIGGGLSLSLNTETPDTARLYNNLFWDNVANANQGADLLIDNDGDGDYLPTPVTLLANNFDQSLAGFKITLPITSHSSNLNKKNPLFVNQAAGNLRLTTGSPMIDAGYPNTPNLPATDLGGGPRVLGAAVDIGAYEFNNGSVKPDFVVTSMVLTPATPFASTTFNAKITVKNQGTLAAKPGTLQVWTHNPNQPNCGAVGNKSATWATNLAPGASIAMNISGLAAGSAGAKTFRAFIDSQCATAESNETNNQLTKAYTVKPAAPDFRVTGMVLTPTSPKAYGTFKAVVTVKNFGTVGGNGGYLDVWNNLGSAAACGADGNAWTSVGSLAAGASKAFTFTGLRSGAKGAKTLRAFVDSYCQSTETLETNNQTVKSYTVVP